MEKKLMTAKSFRHGEIIKTFEKNGKPYGVVKFPCDRCVKGVYVIGVENGQLKPHPNCNGVCFKCQGLGYELKEVRLYTEEEYNKMEVAKERARQKKAEEQKKRMEEEFAGNRVKWLAENGFNENEVTYVYAGADSYQIKDELKEAGFRYDGTLRWHKAEFDERYADRLIEVKFDEVCTMSAWGKGSYNVGAQKIVEEKIEAAQPKFESEFGEDIGKKISNKKVIFLNKFGFFGQYGWTNVYKFQYEKIIYIWMTSSTISEDIKEGDIISLSGTVKSHTTYKGEHQTNLKRCKIEKWDKK